MDSSDFPALKTLASDLFQLLNDIKEIKIAHITNIFRSMKLF